MKSPTPGRSPETRWTHQKGDFYHDGRFATLREVVNHYDGFFRLSLTEQEKNDLIQHLLGL